MLRPWHEPPKHDNRERHKVDHCHAGIRCPACPWAAVKPLQKELTLLIDGMIALSFKPPAEIVDIKATPPSHDIAISITNVSVPAVCCVLQLQGKLAASLSDLCITKLLVFAGFCRLKDFSLHRLIDCDRRSSISRSFAAPSSLSSTLKWVESLHKSKFSKNTF